MHDFSDGIILNPGDMYHGELIHEMITLSTINASIKNQLDF